MMVAAAALSLVSAPIVAQANTRAGDSGATYSSSNSLPGLGREGDGEEIAFAPALLLVFAALGFTTVVADITGIISVFSGSGFVCAISPGATLADCPGAFG